MNKTYGSVVGQCRRDLKFTLRDVTRPLMISETYLSDIERDRRDPPGYLLTRQLASVLNLEEDYLNFLAGRWPEDIKESGTWVSQDKFMEAYTAFRKVLMS